MGAVLPRHHHYHQAPAATTPSILHSHGSTGALIVKQYAPPLHHRYHYASAATATKRTFRRHHPLRAQWSTTCSAIGATTPPPTSPRTGYHCHQAHAPHRATTRPGHAGTVLDQHVRTTPSIIRIIARPTKKLPRVPYSATTLYGCTGPSLISDSSTASITITHTTASRAKNHTNGGPRRQRWDEANP